MGYILPGHGRIITSGINDEFKKIKQGGGDQYNSIIPDILPIRANFSSTRKGDSILKRGSYPDTQRTAPLFNDPRYSSSTLSIPSDSRTLNGLYRFFAETDPIVGSALKLHTDLPLSDLRLGTCADSGVQRHYEDMWERINGFKILNDAVSEYHEIGDCFIFGAFNETDYMWDQFAILNPDYVKVEGSWINAKPLIKLIPDEALKRIVHTKTPRYLYEQLPPEIIKYVLFNQEIPLDPNNVFQLSHAKRPYELRGRSLIKRILKILMLEDRFNQANFALATRHAVPLTVVKVGDPTTGWVPGPEELNSVRDMLAAYELDPNFSIIYHWGINVEYYGSNGKMLPIGPELDRIYRLKFIGLQVHEQLLAGQGGSYSQAYINMEIQRQRYLNLQLKFETMVHSGWFKSIANLCGFYTVTQATVGYGRSSSKKYGNPKDINELSKVFSGIRDYQDNEEFQNFLTKKALEESGKQTRDYVYPKLDWGGMNAAYNENLKNYIKWLTDKRPWLVDDATLARLAKLDRDTQEKAFLEDVKRDQARLLKLSKDGTLAIAQTRGKAIGGGDGGGGTNLGALPDFGGGEIPLGGEAGNVGVSTEPSGPIGIGGPPETSSAQVAPEGISASLHEMEKDLNTRIASDDLCLINENKHLTELQKMERYAVILEISK